jgi:predicted nucleic acid-binding protein
VAEHFFPDTTVLCNFATVDRLPLLRAHLNDRGRVVEAVAREIKKSGEHVPNLSKVDTAAWFGEPIRLDRDGQAEVIDVTRRGAFGGTAAKPLQHLGESQTLFVIQNLPEHSGSIWITDDRAAFNLAKKRGITTRDTVDVLRRLVANGDLSSQSAFEVCLSMQVARSLLNPPVSHRDFER